MFCNQTEDIELCIDQETFTLAETVLEEESDLVNIVSHDTQSWEEDITMAYRGQMMA